MPGIPNPSTWNFLSNLLFIVVLSYHDLPDCFESGAGGAGTGGQGRAVQNFPVARMSLGSRTGSIRAVKHYRLRRAERKKKEGVNK